MCLCWLLQRKTLNCSSPTMVLLLDRVRDTSMTLKSWLVLETTYSNLLFCHHLKFTWSISDTSVNFFTSPFLLISVTNLLLPIRKRLIHIGISFIRQASYPTKIPFLTLVYVVLTSVMTILTIRLTRWSPSVRIGFTMTESSQATCQCNW